MLKKCPKCGKVLPEKEFAPKTRHCKTCRRDYDWQYKYGISPEQYAELLRKQNNKCAICGKELPDGQYLSVDHDNKTGKIRGLLCRECNLGIGMFHENTEDIEKAIRYLKENQ